MKFNYIASVLALTVTCQQTITVTKTIDCSATPAPPANNGNGNTGNAVADNGNGKTNDVVVPPAKGDNNATGKTDNAGATAGNFIFSEDFENLTSTESPNFTIEKGNGAKASITKDAATGTQALQFELAGGDKAFLVPKKLPTGDFFFRMKYKANFPTAPDGAHWVNVQVSGGGSKELPRPIGGQLIGGTNRFGIGSDQGPTGDWTDHDANVLAKSNTFQCVEFEYAPSKDNSINFFLGGKAVLSTTTTKHSINSGNKNAPFILPKPDKIEIGWQQFQAGGQFTVVVDDIAIGTSRIGC
ncbi:hypothetical protein HDV02_001901 [Globomyces sp. JEL0801]|nr:hypothetical protein HDV02_001901 [Globomyces sp. JEL0801]